MESVSLFTDPANGTLTDHSLTLERPAYFIQEDKTLSYSIVHPHPLSRKINSFLKHSFDFIVATLLLIAVFSWLLPVIALLIKIDSKGPVFFLQKRNKKNGKVFTCIKFRTMVVNDHADILPAYENDWRITKFGKILRKNHLDELPQLINVWLGDMSIIGPRPYMLHDNKKYASLIDHYEQRNSVKPGITGLAQSLGHFGFMCNEKEMFNRVELDMVYINKWSLTMDMKIMYRTMMMLLKIK